MTNNETFKDKMLSQKLKLVISELIERTVHETPFYLIGQSMYFFFLEVRWGILKKCINEFRIFYSKIEVTLQVHADQPKEFSKNKISVIYLCPRYFSKNVIKCISDNTSMYIIFIHNYQFNNMCNFKN